MKETLWFTLLYLSTISVTTAQTTAADVSTAEPTTAAITQPETTTIQTTEATTRAIIDLPVQPVPKSCVLDSNQGCNISNFERCVNVRDKTPRCLCLAGFARGRDGIKCEAVTHYRSELVTLNQYSPDLVDRSSAVFRKLQYEAREALFQSMMQSDLNFVTHDVQIRRFMPGMKGNVIVDFEMLLSRSFPPTAQQVEDNLKKGINDVKKPAPKSGEYFIDDTKILTSGNAAKSLKVIAPDPCSEPTLNFCDKNADCITRVRSFTCACKKGYEDVSYNKLATPGSKCELYCNCENGGTCHINEDGHKYCKCPSWYLGEICEVDGKILLIVLCSVLGGLLLIGILCCASCLYKPRMGKRTISIESIPHDDINTVTYKIPRSWFDTWAYYNYAGFPAQAQAWHSAPRPQRAIEAPPRYASEMNMDFPPQQQTSPRSQPSSQRPPYDSWYWRS